MMYWSPECRMLCSTSIVSTSFNAVSWSVLICQNQRAHAPVHRHTALGGNARGQRENRQGNIVAADFKGGRTAFGQGDDGFGVNRARHADRAVNVAKLVLTASGYSVCSATPLSESCSFPQPRR